MNLKTLEKSDGMGELILVDGGLCRFHLRKDKQITIYEIYVLNARRNEGIAKGMLNKLKGVSGAEKILARCPVEYESNSWYKYMGFNLSGKDETRSGKELNVWEFDITDN